MEPARSLRPSRLAIVTAAIACVAVLAAGPASGQFIRESVTNDPTPIELEVGRHRLVLPGNCHVDIPPIPGMMRIPEEQPDKTIRFFWPSGACRSEARARDFDLPGAPDRVGMLVIDEASPHAEYRPGELIRMWYYRDPYTPRQAHVPLTADPRTGLYRVVLPDPEMKGVAYAPRSDDFD